VLAARGGDGLGPLEHVPAALAADLDAQLADAPPVVGLPQGQRPGGPLERPAGGLQLLEQGGLFLPGFRNEREADGPLVVLVGVEADRYPGEWSLHGRWPGDFDPYGVRAEDPKGDDGLGAFDRPGQERAQLVLVVGVGGVEERAGGLDDV